MKTFSDNAGRGWTIQVNVAAIKRVRDLVQVNLLEVIEGKLLDQLVSDPILLCDVIYCICKPEADPRKISDEDFGRAMGGDAIDGATTALLEELVDFFPQAKRRVLAKALAKLKNLETAALKAVETRLDSQELEQQMAEQLAQLRGQDFQGQDFQGQDFQGQGFRGQDFRGQDFRGQLNSSSGTVPASSDSIPAPSP